MKSIFLIAMFLVPSLSFAAENCTTDTSEEMAEEQLLISTDVPKHLEGATITIRTKDGRESSVPAEKFKVVPRKQQFITTKTKQTSQTVCSAERNAHRLNLLVGTGPKGGLHTNRAPTEVTIESRNGVIGGLQYQLLVTEKVNLGIQVQSNESALFNIGHDFDF